MCLSDPCCQFLGVIGLLNCFYFIFIHVDYFIKEEELKVDYIAEEFDFLKDL
jgi:hypothetical protein